MINNEVTLLGRNPKHRLDRSELEKKKADWLRTGFEVTETTGNNPLCGDDLTMVFASDEKGELKEAYWTGYTCTLCAAATEVVITLLKAQNMRACSVEIEDVLHVLKNPQVGRTRRACVMLPVSALREANVVC